MKQNKRFFQTHNFYSNILKYAIKIYAGCNTSASLLFFTISKADEVKELGMRLNIYISSNHFEEEVWKGVLGSK